MNPSMCVIEDQYDVGRREATREIFKAIAELPLSVGAAVVRGLPDDIIGDLLVLVRGRQP